MQDTCVADVEEKERSGKNPFSFHFLLRSVTCPQLFHEMLHPLVAYHSHHWSNSVAGPTTSTVLSGGLVATS